MFLEISIGLAGLTVLYFIFDKFYLQKQKIKDGKLINILLFEQIGENKTFIGKYKGQEENDEKIGIYIIINKVKKAISGVNNIDFFGDKETGKSLIVCKYSDDDYRVMSALKNNEWYKKIDLEPEEYFETEEKEIDGEITFELKLDKKGNPIPLCDENGSPLPNYDFEPYQEPLGVSQDSREAQRFNRDFVRRMQEKRKEVPGWWDKWGQTLVMASVVLIMFLSLAYQTNKFSEMSDNMISEWGDKADDLVVELRSPTFAEQLLNKIERKNTEAEAPPK